MLNKREREKKEDEGREGEREGEADKVQYPELGVPTFFLDVICRILLTRSSNNLNLFLPMRFKVNGLLDK